jgi:uncharacterized membrane protein
MAISLIIGIIFLVVLISIYFGIYSLGKKYGAEKNKEDTQNENIKQAQEIIKNNESNYTASSDIVDQQLREFERKDN